LLFRKITPSERSRYNQVRSDKKRSKFWLISILCLIIVLPGGWFLWERLENEKPAINLNLLSPHIGRTQEFTLSVSDSKSGLRRLWVGLLKNGQETILYNEKFPSAGFFKGGQVHEKSVKIQLEPVILGFSDGEAILRTVVTDYSWRDWLRGNKIYTEKNVVIDTHPPEIEILSHAHNINRGGAGLVIFRVSETCSQSGVQVGDSFYPGHTGFFKDANVYLAFIALGYQQGTDTAIYAKVADLAGNQAKSGLNYHLRRKNFRQDRLNITDSFLKRKMPNFSSQITPETNSSLVDKFLKINRDLREANYQKIVEVCRHTDAKIYWQGDFIRLPKSATRAKFADHRIYMYKGREIDRQVHMGIDLASVARSQIPAANAGIVIFAESLGIYGKTVIVDHGFSLFSMYAHLSHIGVKVRDPVAKGDILGRTGVTGLAGGDHLHFSMLIHDTFVNPVEWWDKNWIRHNVISKIESTGIGINQE
jgi:murein DD-endopeptidase MepM/ murein hydrolase activator NlpD